MRAILGWSAILAATLLATSGCRSGASSSGWSWNRKGHGNPGVNNIASPALPSSTATPSGAAPGYPINNAQPGTNGMADHAGNPYPATPASATYPGSYPNPNAPGANVTAGAAMPAAGYPAQAGQPYNPPAAPAGGVAAQTGPYNENYGQTSAAALAATVPTGNPAAMPGGAPPTDAYPNPAAYANPATAYANPAANPAGATGAYAPAENYRAPAQPAADAYANTVADASAGSRYANNAPGAPVDAAAADRYATQNAAAGDPGTAGTSGAAPYQPGVTNYNPPGVPPYQVPGQANVVSTPRRDPYYRPGGTTDYLPSGSVPATASTPTDRYAAPPSGSDPAAGAHSYR